MKPIVMLAYKLFRMVGNGYYKRHPERLVPMIETMRLSAFRDIGSANYRKCSETWARIRMGGILRGGGTILIAGLPRHGKTHVSDLIAKWTCLASANTSDLIAEEVRKVFIGLDMSNKEDVRDAFIRTGDDMCRHDPAAILKTLHGRGYRVIAGVRKPAELRAFLNWNPKTFVLWVDRPGHPTVKDNTLLTPDYCDTVLINDEDCEDSLKTLLGVK